MPDPNQLARAGAAERSFHAAREPLRFLSLFAGIGGIDLGLERAGMRCVAQVEIDPFCRAVLAKHWPDVPRFEDVRTVTAADFVEPIDVIAGGFPCQDISRAGNGIGIDGDRSGLWSEFYRLIREIRPVYVLVENVAALLERGLGRVLGELAAVGFDAEWSVLPACALGAPHSRERVFLVAHAHEIGRRCWRNRVPDAPRCDHWKATQGQRKWEDVERWLGANFKDSDGATAIPTPIRMVDGLSAELDDTREAECGAFGNAVVPQVAEFIGRMIVAADAQRESERAA
jgi:DNA (cytosine-5)-methyltransferase 1